MFAAFKADVLEFVTYEGTEKLYPEWFQELIDLNYIIEGDGWSLYMNDEELSREIPLVYGDVFMVNNSGQIRHFTAPAFHDLFYIVD